MVQPQRELRPSHNPGVRLSWINVIPGHSKSKPSNSFHDLYSFVYLKTYSTMSSFHLQFLDTILEKHVVPGTLHG